MVKHFKNPNKMTLIKPRKSTRHPVLTKTPPTVVSQRESDNLRKTEKLQQDDIDKEFGDIKKGIEDARDFLSDEMIKKKLQILLQKLPKQDRIRNLIDQDREELNKSKFRSSLKLKE